MIRSITIFSFFAVATILVIVLQPGPRSEYSFEESLPDAGEASRNDMSVLRVPVPLSALQAPDDVLTKLKAAARRVDEPEVEPNAAVPARSVDRLQAALSASLGKVPANTEPTPEVSVSSPVQRAVPVASIPSVNPDLRAMSWQTLSMLNGLGTEAKAPGQEGSLLNSIVRRSMGQVTGQEMPITGPTGQPVRNVTPQPAPKVAQGGAGQTYVVEPGDTLALIAIKLYGSALASDHILDDNPALKANPDALRIGQVLRYRHD